MIFLSISMPSAIGEPSPSLLWWNRTNWSLLRVEHLGKEVRRRKMLWFHLPIIDVSTPDEGFERRWEVAGDELRALLRSGRDVLVHCRGGLGEQVRLELDS